MSLYRFVAIAHFTMVGCAVGTMCVFAYCNKKQKEIDTIIANGDQQLAEGKALIENWFKQNPNVTSHTIH